MLKNGNFLIKLNEKSVKDYFYAKKTNNKQNGWPPLKRQATHLSDLAHPTGIEPATFSFGN